MVPRAASLFFAWLVTVCLAVELVQGSCGGWIGFDADLLGTTMKNVGVPAGTDNHTADLFCCNACANHTACEFWVRDLTSHICSLRRDFRRFGRGAPRRGNFLDFSCRVEVDPARVTHRLNPHMFGCHSDAGYAHEARGLFAEMLYPSAFEPVPDGPVVRDPGYGCAWSGAEGDLAGDTFQILSVKGETDEARDAMCCAACDCSAGCEAWSRRVAWGDGVKYGWRCELRQNLFQPPQRNRSGVRSNLKSASKGKCGFSNSWFTRGKARLVVGGPASGLMFAPSQALPPQPAWDLFPGHACGGRTRFEFRKGVPSFEACQARCANRSECAQFEWAQQDKWCALFNAGNTSDPRGGGQPYSCGCKGLCPTTDGPAPTAFSLQLSGPGDSGSNRGFGNEGLHLQAGKAYEGFFILNSSASAKLQVALETVDGAVLASADVDYEGGPWARIQFSLTPKAGAECVGIDHVTAVAENIACPLNGTYNATADMSDRTAHICVRCGGQFRVTLLSAGAAVQVGFASLMPGAWGRFKGLPVRADAAAMLQEMGISLLRFGGTYVSSSSGMEWKRWRGARWLRPPSIASMIGAGSWHHGRLSGWGIFEMADFCQALGAVCVIDLHIDSEKNSLKFPPAYFADLVEYMHGDEHTEWGRLRIADGHPTPYNVTIFELGRCVCGVYVCVVCVRARVFFQHHSSQQPPTHHHRQRAI